MPLAPPSFWSCKSQQGLPQQITVSGSLVPLPLAPPSFWSYRSQYGLPQQMAACGTLVPLPLAPPCFWSYKVNKVQKSIRPSTANCRLRLPGSFAACASHLLVVQKSIRPPTANCRLWLPGSFAACASLLLVVQNKASQQVTELHAAKAKNKTKSLLWDLNPRPPAC